MICDVPLEYLVVDEDCTDTEEERELADTMGDILWAAIDRYEASADPEAVRHYFQQQPLNTTE